MAMKSKLTAVAAGLLLVALGGLAVSRGFLFGESGGGRASSSPPPQLGNGAELGAGPARPHLAGAPPRNADGQHTPTARGESVLTAETPSGLDVRGVVVNEEGKPVEGVTVFRISKGLAGLDDLRGPHATSDAAGRFALKMESSASAWVGAVKDGYLPAYVDGDAMPDPQSVRLPLVAGGEVRVRLESDDPEALLFSTVTLTAETGTEAWDFPAPGHDPRTSVWTELGPDHRALLRIGTKGPVRVTASGGGIFWVSDPAEVVLDRPEGDVTFRIVRSCAVRLRVTEADGRTPFALPFQVARLDSVTGKLLTGGSTTNPERTGVFDDVGYFWPGSYRMRVTAEGFAPFTSEPFTLRRFGEELRLVAPLVPDSARMGGTVVLTVPVAARSGATWYLDAASPPGRGAPSLLLRRSGGAWYTPAGTQVLPSGEILVGESGWSEGARQLRILQVPPGSYEALVWDRGTWTCGYVPQLAVAAGSTANATVALVPGVRIRIRDLAGPATLARKLRLRAVGVEDLPAVEFQSASSAQTYGDYPPPPEVVLSPLPFDSVWASFDLPDGTRKEVEIKSKP